MTEFQLKQNQKRALLSKVRARVSRQELEKIEATRAKENGSATPSLKPKCDRFILINDLQNAKTECRRLEDMVAKLSEDVSSEIRLIYQNYLQSLQKYLNQFG